ncbi:hypothetical protein N780_14800 [Pontibacillus chungwhensis BH030062]|uniref:Uncharacterized protein n=1 Tax=Pontibacillus chungwhensis BH030062 TaxID=1385513 RepID=A0A0A2V140_9BACI|nr:hypothetical protein [Pontibacillus chungwhensis]KGP92753.1 hypothetical protein N780_14800 [Pontibacillus chungwhensis BH030062]
MKRMVAIVWSMMWVMSLASVVKVVTVSKEFLNNVSVRSFAQEIVQSGGYKGREGVLDFRSMNSLCQAKEFWCKARGSPRGKIDELIVYLVRVRSRSNELPSVS